MTKVIIGIVLPFLGTTLGSATVFFLKKEMNSKLQNLLRGFAAGVMIAASVWSLLIPSIDMAEAAGKTAAWLPAVVGFLIGIGFMLLLDSLIPHLHTNSARPEGRPSAMGKNLMLMLAVTLHNIPEGMAVGIVLAGMQPHIAHFEPVVREFHLPAVDDLLAENAELVADGEAGHGIVQAGRCVHVARGQTAKAAIAESCVRLKRTEAFQTEAEIVQNLTCRFQQTHVIKIVAQARADQKFHRHVIDLLALLCSRLLDECAAIVFQKLAHSDAYSAVDLLFCRHFKRAAEHPVAAFL